jgi:GMP synthase-like glutamine amidotransferase
LDLVEQWLTEAGLTVDIIKPHLGQIVPGAIPAAYAGLIALGGTMGAHDDEEFDWLTPERALMKDAIAQDFPFIGICLGAQILATAVDGQSVRTPKPEAGLVEVQISEEVSDDQLFGKLAGQKLRVTGWHQDYIVNLPDEAVLIASTPECPVHAFRMGKNVYGMQFHPEVRTQTVQDWATPNDSVLKKLGKSPQEAVAEVEAVHPELVKTWQPVFQRWAKLVLDSHAEELRAN